MCRGVERTDYTTVQTDALFLFIFLIQRRKYIIIVESEDRLGRLKARAVIFFFLYLLTKKSKLIRKKRYMLSTS